MFNMKARTEINDAQTNIVLAEAYLLRGEYKAATTAIFDAERHCRSARSNVTIEQSDWILQNLSALRTKLDQLQNAVKTKSAGVGA